MGRYLKPCSYYYQKKDHELIQSPENIFLLLPNAVKREKALNSDNEGAFMDINHIF